MDVTFRMKLSEFPFGGGAGRNAAKFTEAELDKIGEEYMSKYFRRPSMPPTAREVDEDMEERPGMMAELIGRHWDDREGRLYTTREEWAADWLRTARAGEPEVEEFISSGFGGGLDECDDDRELEELYIGWLDKKDSKDEGGR